MFYNDVKFHDKTTTIKYMNPWLDEFKQFWGGRLLFYPGNPKYIVEVTILSDTNNVRLEDIFISLGKHNSPDIQNLINQNANYLLNLCKESGQYQFVIDVDEMKIINYDYFTETFPMHGLNTFFVLEGKDSSYFTARCLMNPSKVVFNDDELFSWFLSYINSLNSCLSPINEVKSTPRLFLQAISCMINNLDVIISNDPAFMHSAISDNGKQFMDLEINTERFKVLMSKSREQMIKDRKKRSIVLL